MPDPTVTARDRDLAGLYMARWDEAEWKTALEMLTELSAQARREGREEGLGEARTVALSEAIYLRKHLDDQHQADGAERVEKRLTALLDQPAPEGAKE